MATKAEKLKRYEGYLAKARASVLKNSARIKKLKASK